MRSLLFVPADSEKKLAKGMATGADVLILDLEDSVAAAGKARAREMSREFMASARKSAAPGGPLLYVRINALTTEHWQADIAGLGDQIPDGIMLPKSLSGEHVHQLSVALGHQEEKAGAPSGKTRIIAIATEVAGSILQLPSYIGSSSRLDALTWGAEDLSVELGSTTSREPDGTWTSPYRLVRDLTLITAAAAEVQAIDTVYVDFKNRTGLALEASMAARDGFTGKMAIHPDQVSIINEAFTPPPAEIERARAIVAAFEASPGAGVISLDGGMLDRPHLTRAQRVLARAQAGARGSGAAGKQSGQAE